MRVVNVLERNNNSINDDSRYSFDSYEKIHDVILEKLKHLSESDNEVLKPVLLNAL